MKNSIVQILIFISLIYITIFFAFRSDSYCASSALIGQTLWNSYNIASEYYAARAGRNIINASETTTDISGVSGISNGVSSDDYSQIFSNNANFTAEYIMQNIRDVDVSELSIAEKAKLASIMAANNQSPYAYKAFTLGGITLYYAVNELGEWIGNSYDNIVAKFDSMTQTKIDSIENFVTNDYPINSDYLYGSDFTFVNGSNIYYQMHFTSNVFVACGSGANSARVYVLSPTSTISALGKWYVNGELHDITDAYISTNYQPFGSLVSDNLDFYYGALEFQFDYGSHNYVYTSNTFGNIDDLISNFSTSYLNDAYSSELVDYSGVPYTVPDLDGYGSTIGDIYPAIQALRDFIITIPDADTIASGLTGTLTDAIEDVIAAIKELAITVPDVKEGDEPVPNPDPEFPDSIPVGYWPSFIPDLLDLDLFSIFKPVFDIVGEDYSMFSTWMLIPSILLFLIILYLVVSVF